MVSQVASRGVMMQQRMGENVQGMSGEELNKPASRVRLSSRSLGKLTLLSAETTTGNDMVRNPKWKEISFDGAQ